MATMKASMTLDGQQWNTEVALPGAHSTPHWAPPQRPAHGTNPSAALAEGRPTPEAIKELKQTSMEAVNAFMAENQGTGTAAAAGAEAEPNVMEEGDDIEVEDDDIQQLAAEGAAASAKKRKIAKK